MQSKATSIKNYLAELPMERRQVIQAVRQVILANLDPTAQEGMQYGMIGYFVPHSVCPAGYHCDPKQPLPFICLAAQKARFAIYMMGLYTGGDCDNPTPLARWFHKDLEKLDKRLDLGKSCIRFKKLEDLPLELIGRTVKRQSVAQFIRQYEKSLSQQRSVATKKSTRNKQESKTKISRQIR
jgi:hypothetical protein